MREMENALTGDAPSERVLSSMCPIPHPVASRVHSIFLHTNLGDPGLFIGTSEIEQKLIIWLGELLHHPGAAGYVTSGGTESNIQALSAFKHLHR